MSGIDSRVLDMRFENRQFEQGIRQSTQSLDQFSNKLQMQGATRGLDEIDKKARGFSLSGMASAVDSIVSKFGTLSMIGITTLTNLTNRAVDFGLNFAKQFTIAPIIEGLREYETQMNSVQTILANTSSKGTNLKQVNAALDQLNEYSDKTIYNFSEMARNIGTFTAAGVGLDQSVSSIKGIANLAAVSGSSSMQASTAMYQLSQAIASGTVRLQDWNSVVNAGMGGEVFQNALKDTARAQGVAIDALIKKEGSFRESLDKGWLTSKIMTETLAKFTGDLTDAQLKQMGYNASQIKSIQAMAKQAQDAATKVKTFTQLMDTLKESAQSGWAQSWRIVTGDFEEAKALYTNVSNVLGGMIGASADARNKLLQDWKNLGGRTAVIGGISNAFTALMTAIKPVSEAFRSVFPPVTAQQLVNLSLQFEKFTKKLIMGETTATKVRQTMQGFFSAVKMGGQAIGILLAPFGKFLGLLGIGGGKLLNAAAQFGVYLHALEQSGQAMEKFRNAAKSISSAIDSIVSRFKNLGKATGEGGDGGVGGMGSGILAAIDGFVNRLKERFGFVTRAADQIKEQLKKLFSGGSGVSFKFELNPESFMNSITRFMDVVGKGLDMLMRNVTNAFSKANFSKVGDALNVALQGGLIAMVVKFIGTLSKLSKESTGVLKSMQGAFKNLGGSFTKIGGMFDGVTGALQGMQSKLKAEALMSIAKAIALLVASLFVLALIDSDALTKGTVAISALFADLVASMALLDKAMTGPNVARIPAVAASMTVLAGAMLLLTASVAILGNMSWTELAKGLGSVIILMGAMVGISRTLGKDTMGLTSAAFSMIIVGAALNVLATAVGKFGSMDTKTLEKGMVSIGLVMAGMVAMSKGMSGLKGMVSGSVAMLSMATAMVIMATALDKLGGMSWTEITKGIVAMTGAVGGIALAMRLLPKNMIGASLEIQAIALAMRMLVPVMQGLGGLSWEEIGKGLATMGASLLIFAGGAKLLNGSLTGVAGIAIMAVALNLLIIPIKALGELPLMNIVQGLVAIAAVFAIIGIAGALLAPVVPAILGLAAAVALIGASVLFAGVGVLAFATAIAVLGTAFAVSTTVIVAGITAILSLIPVAMVALAVGILAFASVIANGAPALTGAFKAVLQAFLQSIVDSTGQIVSAMVQIMIGLLNAVDTMAPRIVQTMLQLLDLLIAALRSAVPKIARNGLEMLLALLEAIKSKIPDIVNVGGDIIIAFINAMSAKFGQIADAGARAIVSFVNSLASAIRNHTSEMNEAGARLGYAIVDGMSGGILSKGQAVVNRAREMASQALAAIANVINSNSPSKETYKLGTYFGQGFTNAIGDQTSNVVVASSNMAKGALSAMSDAMSGISDTLTDVDNTPVIRPVVDLDAVMQASNAIPGLLGGDTNIGTSGNINTANSIANGINYVAPVGNTAASSNNTLEFNQHIYSPKPLSRLEIYRNTRNQLELAREVIQS